VPSFIFSRILNGDATGNVNGRRAQDFQGEDYLASAPLDGGGIAVKILEKMKDGTFFHAFKDKWKFEGLLSNIPVSIVLNESAPLLGAAYEALAASDK